VCFSVELDASKHQRASKVHVRTKLLIPLHFSFVLLGDKKIVGFYLVHFTKRTAAPFSTL
jgi:hypothetical protein